LFSLVAIFVVNHSIFSSPKPSILVALTVDEKSVEVNDRWLFTSEMQQ